jgi:hypothetical protein
VGEKESRFADDPSLESGGAQRACANSQFIAVVSLASNSDTVFKPL